MPVAGCARGAPFEPGPLRRSPPDARAVLQRFRGQGNSSVAKGAVSPSRRWAVDRVLARPAIVDRSLTRMDSSLTERLHRVDGVRIGRTDDYGGCTMSTTKMTTRSLAIAAVLGLASACATPTTSDAPAGATEQEAPQGPEDETSAEAGDYDHVDLPEERYRLELECPRPGELLPC